VSPSRLSDSLISKVIIFPRSNFIKKYLIAEMDISLDINAISSAERSGFLFLVSAFALCSRIFIAASASM
jgi:hypothetical protein